MGFTNMREAMSTYSHMAKIGLSPFVDYGLGAMTKAQRAQLIREGKIVHQDGVDAIACRPVGILEYMPKGTEILKTQRINGPDLKFIQFRLDEAEGIVKTSKDKLIRSEIAWLPVWDGKLPDATDKREWEGLAQDVAEDLKRQESQAKADYIAEQEARESAEIQKEEDEKMEQEHESIEAIDL